MKNKSVIPYILLKHEYSATDMHRLLSSHCHDFYQIVYVTSGVGTIHMSEHAVPLSSGNIVLIPPSVKHSLRTDSKSMVTIELKFDLFDDTLVELFAKDTILFCENHEEISSLFQKLFQEAQKNDFLAEDHVILLLSQILVLLARFLYSDKRRSDPKKSLAFTHISDDRLAQSIRKFIEDNSEQNLRTEDIAASFYLSSASLHRKFMKAYQISPIQYLNNIRIQKAKHLLETTDYSITEISDMVGFSSIHYFSKCFSAKEKLSPANYRSSKKNNYSVTYRTPLKENC